MTHIQAAEDEGDCYLFERHVQHVFSPLMVGIFLCKKKVHLRLIAITEFENTFDILNNSEDHNV